MPVYEYSALDIKGKAAKGVLDADSVQSACNRLRAQSLFPTDIKEAHDDAPKKAPSLFHLRRPFARVKASQVAMITRQMATLTGAGLPLVSAIDVLIPLTDAHVFKKQLTHIKDAIVEGQSFAQALSLYPETFPPMYVSMVEAGETSGTLEIVLQRLADITEKQLALKNRIRSALAYPILMSFVCVLVLFFLLTYIVPNITSVFAEMSQVLPAPTRFLIFISTWIQSFWWLILAAAFAGLAAYKLINKTAAGRLHVDKIKLRLPSMGPLTRKLAVARFGRTLGSLLENGVPLIAALGIAKNVPANVCVQKVVESCAQAVAKGQSLAGALAEGRLFPALFIQMIQVGEQSGELESMLNKVADVYDDEVERTIMQVTSLLEPIMILFMGLLVGFIVVSIILPIFEMNQLVR